MSEPKTADAVLARLRDRVSRADSGTTHISLPLTWARLLVARAKAKPAKPKGQAKPPAATD